MKLGVNTVLFKKYPLADAMRACAKIGYDGVELSAISGMCEHLVLDDWQAQAEGIRALAAETGLALLSMEVASLDGARLEKAFAAARALGVSVVNVGPGGKSNEEGALEKSIETLTALAGAAARYGVTLCCKAHVGAAIFDTPTTLAAMAAIGEPHFGIDMDPSHIHRAGERPEKAIAEVVSRVKHVHIRDCKGIGPSPGTPELQICGAGDIDLYGYFEALAGAHYDGPVCLEVIGPELDMTDAINVAAQSYGYMNACLKRLGAR